MLNYDSWCSVSVAGATASTAGTQVVCVADGSVSLVASPASASFELGDWYGTSGDTGSGDPGTVSNDTSAASYSTGDAGAGCVSVCCPFTNGMGCPTTNQCP